VFSVTVVPAEIFIPDAIAVLPAVPISVSVIEPFAADKLPPRLIEPVEVGLSDSEIELSAFTLPKLIAPFEVCDKVTEVLLPEAEMFPKVELPPDVILIDPAPAVISLTADAPAIFRLIDGPVMLPVAVTVPVPV
jgi:hypothetical protein